jgi:hypothetical protein
MQAFFPCQEQEATHSAFRKQRERTILATTLAKSKQKNNNVQAASPTVVFPFEKRIGAKNLSSHLFCLFVGCHLVLLRFKQQQ